MSVDINALDDPFRSKVVMLLQRLDGKKIRYAVTETRRSFLAQQDAFRRGASKRDGLKMISLHQAGLAVDIVPLDEGGKPTWDYAKHCDAYKQIANEARLLGLECGQDWPPFDPGTQLGWDPPHYEMRGA